MRLIPFLLAQAVALTWTPSPTPNATTTVYRINGTCPVTIMAGTQIVANLTSATYTDSTVAQGASYCYYAVATAAGIVSVPSNTFTALIPTPAVLTPTLMGVGTRVVNGNLTSVAVTVTANGKPVTQGTVTWTVAGVVFFTDTLNKKGQDVNNVWTPMLANLHITITYSGSSTFAPSTATVQ